MQSSLIISGGSGKSSRTVELAKALSRELSVWTIYLNSGDSIPLLNSEFSSQKNFPSTIDFLVQKIREHETIILVFPQYNYNFSAFFKNVLDWCSLKSRKLFSDKTVVLVGVSQGDVGMEEFKQVSSLTINAIGGEKIVFFNTTPATKLSDLIAQLKRYV